MKLFLGMHRTLQSAFADFLCYEIGWIDIFSEERTDAWRDDQ